MLDARADKYFLSLRVYTMLPTTGLFSNDLKLD